MAGFTTVQSVGSPADLPLRDAIAKGTLPGPRILTCADHSWVGANKPARRTRFVRLYENKRKQARIYEDLCGGERSAAAAVVALPRTTQCRLR